MTYLLRHGAQENGIPIDDKGYILLQDLLDFKTIAKHKLVAADIFKLVDSNDKKRF